MNGKHLPREAEGRKKKVNFSFNTKAQRRSKAKAKKNVKFTC